MEAFNFKNQPAWWLGYFIRYFIGAAVGILIVQYLVANSTLQIMGSGFLKSQFEKSAKYDLSNYYIWFLVVTGFAYSYIASAPVLVFHATRGIIINTYSTNDNSEEKSSCAIKRFIKNYYIPATYFIIVMLVLCCSLYWRLSPSIHILSYAMGEASLVFGAFSALFVAQVILVQKQLRSKDSIGFTYYSKICDRRATATDSGREYMSSYRGLREHGNAYFVLALEVILGALLYFAPNNWILVILLWIFPAACIWLLAVILESRHF